MEQGSAAGAPQKSRLHCGSALHPGDIPASETDGRTDGQGGVKGNGVVGKLRFRFGPG